ncbi:MAG: hypothetical protein ACI4FY_01755 [Acetatifactor sp.]
MMTMDRFYRSNSERQAALLDKEESFGFVYSLLGSDKRSDCLFEPGME